MATDRYTSGARSSIKKFDGKNYTTEGPTAEIPKEFGEDGESFNGTGCSGTAASHAYADYNWRL
jgi:hypothetical protein